MTMMQEDWAEAVEEALDQLAERADDDADLVIGLTLLLTEAKTRLRATAERADAALALDEEDYEDDWA